MKTKLLVVALSTVVLGACSTTGTNQANQGNLQDISQQRQAIDFRRDGVKVGASGGKLEYIEVTGYAPVWGGSQNAKNSAYEVAGLNAKKQFNDWLNREKIVSSTSIKMISKNLEQAKDTKTQNSGQEVATDDESIANGGDDVAVTKNRQDALDIATKLNQTIRITNRGIISGLYLKDASVINDGTEIRATYRYDKSHEQIRQQLRQQISM